jgi:hypothetical protein
MTTKKKTILNCTKNMIIGIFFSQINQTYNYKAFDLHYCKLKQPINLILKKNT